MTGIAPEMRPGAILAGIARNRCNRNVTSDPARPARLTLARRKAVKASFPALMAGKEAFTAFGESGAEVAFAGSPCGTVEPVR